MKKARKKEKEKMNYFWIWSLVGGVLILLGLIFPCCLVQFENESCIWMNVWIFGFYYIECYQSPIAFSFSLTTILAVVTLSCNVMILKITDKGRKNVKGLWFLWLLILPTIVVFMPILTIMVVNDQKFLFASLINYSSPLDGVKINQTGSLLLILFGALITYNAVWHDLFYRLRRSKEKKKKEN